MSRYLTVVFNTTDMADEQIADITSRHDARVMSWSHVMDERDNLRQQVAVLQINNTKFLEISIENERLKQQLAEANSFIETLATTCQNAEKQLAYLQEELGNPPTDWHLLKQQLAEANDYAACLKSCL